MIVFPYLKSNCCSLFLPLILLFTFGGSHSPSELVAKDSTHKKKGKCGPNPPRVNEHRFHSHCCPAIQSTNRPLLFPSPHLCSPEPVPGGGLVVCEMRVLRGWYASPPPLLCFINPPKINSHSPKKSFRFRFPVSMILCTSVCAGHSTVAVDRKPKETHFSFALSISLSVSHTHGQHKLSAFLCLCA